MTEETTKIILIALNYLGWGVAILFGVGYWNQKKEISKLTSVIEVLQSQDAERRRKDKTRDEILKMLSEILSDEKMHRDNKKKIDELFGDLLKPWKTDEKP